MKYFILKEYITAMKRMGTLTLLFFFTIKAVPCQASNHRISLQSETQVQNLNTSLLFLPQRSKIMDNHLEIDKDNLIIFQSSDAKHQLSIQSSEGSKLTVYASNGLSSEIADHFPYGKINFSVEGLQNGSSTVVTLTLPEDANVQHYWKYGPTPEMPYDHWYNFEYNGQVGAVIKGNVITLHYIDGALGDDDLTENGIVKDPGGPTVGTPSFNNVSPYGDVDFNGSVQSYDAATTLQYSAGLDPFPNVDPAPWTNERTTAADVDGNGLVQAYDAAMIQQYVVGLIDSLPVNSGTPKMLANAADLNLLYTQDGTDIVVSGSSNSNLFASNLEFHYSSNEINLDSASTTDFSQSYLVAQNVTNDNLHLGMMSIQPPSGDGEFVRIPFRISNDSASIEIHEIVNAQDAVVRHITLFKDLTKNGNDLTIPTTNRLYQNFPNPFNPTTTIKYDLKSADRVSLSIYNIRGEQVTTLVNENKPAGAYQIVWDGTNQNNIPVASGIYITRLQIGSSYTKINRMVLLR